MDPIFDALKLIGSKEDFVGNEEFLFEDLVNYMIKSTKEVFSETSGSSPAAFIVLSDGSLYMLNLASFPTKDDAAHILRLIASFHGTYGIIVIMESWIKKMKLDDPAAKDFLNGNKQVGECDDKEECLFFIAETVKDFKTMIMVPIIRTEDKNIVFGPEQRSESIPGGRFCNFFDKTSPEMMSAKAHLN